MYTIVHRLTYRHACVQIPTTAKAVSIFSCRPLFEDISAGSYLASNPSIVCWEGAHIRLCGFAALFVLFDLICLPASVGFVLLKTGANGVRQNSQEYRAKYGFLYMRFEGDFYYWHIIVVAVQFWIILAIEFGGGLAPLLKFFLILVPISPPVLIAYKRAQREHGERVDQLEATSFFLLYLFASEEE